MNNHDYNVKVNIFCNTASPALQHLKRTCLNSNI